MDVAAGTAIFRQGDPGEEMFVIARGRVRLVLGSPGHERTIAVLEPGDFFGELSLLSGARRTASAIAVEDSTLLPIRRDAFAMMMQDDLEVVFRMMDALGRRLGQTDEQLHELARTLARIRAAADLLRRALAAADGAVELHPAELAAAWGADAEGVEATLGELAGGGAVTREGGRWRLDGSERGRRRLVELVLGWAG